MSRRNEERRYTNVRDRMDKRESGYTPAYLNIPKGMQMFAPKKGVVLLDILPYEVTKDSQYASKGALHFERTVYVHRGIGANSDSHLCPRLNSKKPCPICEYRRQLMTEADPKDEEVVKDLAPKERQLFNVIDLKEPDKGVQLWDISYHLFGKVLEAQLANADQEDDFEKKWDGFFFLEDGLTLKVGFGEKTFSGATFYETETIGFRERREQYDEVEMLEKVAPLDDILIEQPYDKLKAIFLESSKEKTPDKKAKEEDREEDDRPAKSSSRRDEKEEDDEKPARSSRRDEPEEDEKPAKSSSSKEPEPEEEEERPAKGSRDRDTDREERRPRRDEPEDDERPAKSSSRRDVREEEEEKPARRSRDEDERPAKSSSKEAPKKVSKDDDNWDDFNEDRGKDAKPSSCDREEDDERTAKSNRR